MSSLAASALDLAWSLWTELGVAGVTRSHRAVAIDPEPLVVWSAHVIRHEARLRDLVFGWCVEHSDRISASRLKGVASRYPAPFQESFEEFAGALHESAGIRWPGRTSTDWPVPSQLRKARLPFTRPALLRFRLRALCGVGSRADVLSELLARLPEWTSAADLADEGYSKRNVARVLSEFRSSHLVDELSEGNRLSFRLRRPEVLSVLVAGGIRRSGLEWFHDPHHPPWRPILEMFAHTQALEERFVGRNEAAKRIAAHNLINEIKQSAMTLGYVDVPKTTGNPVAYDAVLEWAGFHLAALASGTSSVLRPTRSWGTGDPFADGPFPDGSGRGDGSSGS